jgi:hypothetical protein
MVRCDYVLPLRWTADDGRLSELTGYLRSLGKVCDVIVVDGSPEPVYAGHARAWVGLVRHCRPDPELVFLNGKVNGVHTGLRRCTADFVVIADDDVRYEPDGLRRVVARLRDADVVVPQNYFSPAPWHARWDTGRSLLNRAFGSDYPGTLAVRRDTWLRTGGYDGNVLFENLELLRTVQAAGGKVVAAPDLYVRRLPPAADGFRSQRVRQAYDSLAQPGRLAVELAAIPALVGAARAGGVRGVVALLAAVVGAAEVGRRRAGGRRVFPPDAALWAPAWLVERGLCSWAAVGQRVIRGGVAYHGNRLRLAAHSVRELRASRRERDQDAGGEQGREAAGRRWSPGAR